VTKQVSMISNMSYYSYNA